MNNYRIPNLAKACQALTWLAGEDRSFSASEVARRMQMPRTTAFRMLRTLQSEGLVDEDDGQYRSGIGLLRLGLLAMGSVQMNSLAEPVLKQLAQSTGETAHLAVPAGNQMLILNVVDSPDPIRVASRPGTLVSIHCAATGKAVLASMTTTKAMELIHSSTLDKHTSNTITDPVELDRDLQLIRKRGYALDDEEYYDGTRCLAAAVFDVSGQPIGAIGITAGTERFPKRKITTVAARVTRAAEELSAMMGQGIMDHSVALAQGK